MSAAPVELERTALVRPEVVEAYFGPKQPNVHKIGSGMVNVTLLATDSDRGEVVLQELNEVFNEGAVQDATTVASHLAGDGWEVPETVRTLDGATSFRDNTRTTEVPHGRLWRASRFIPGAEGAPEPPTAEMYEQVGGLLGRFHRSLRGLDYEPKYKIPNFHDTGYHLGQLNELRKDPAMPAWAQEMAAEVLRDYQGLPEIPEEVSKEQLIHGDPRTGNMLFRGGKPFTLCDFDTFMMSTIWVDLGDLLRSLAEDAIEKREATLPMADIRRVVEGYRQESGLDYDPEEFFGWAMTGAKRITLELNARFLNDMVVPYFAPDPDRYPSREAFDFERATLQRKIFANLSQSEQGVSHV